ncbi:SDR family oxidoreductase [Candidatus Nitrospira allomarina]|uniref:Sugar nucleotide-binding protein n=1 Tax=Candidatus Nitrospira allomarina TaxID=3020900 RepID=A0AA96K0N3_9BACT|nr:sugar nucleotide-binding protein [Candidatus Nitrospira allomarina]WNM59849.1 sugar nucleotide-binding protein [Candidatus Nitrospira allomarina]
MKTRLLVTGGAGFLGNHLLRRANQFVAAGTLHVTPSTSLPGVTFHVCDLQSPEEVRVLMDRVQPDVMIHTACSEQGKGIDAILPAAGLLAMQSVERNIRFIHLSTDQVFDGTSAPYTEESPTNPINPYGKAKAQAEELIRSLNPKATIVRTSLLYDLRTPDRQTTRLIESTKAGEQYRLFIDERRCPIWVENLAEVLLEVATKDVPGIVHLGGPESLNRWDLGMGLLQHFGIAETSNIQMGTIEESGLIRPMDLTMDSSRAKQALETPLLSLQKARRMAATSKI